MVGALGTQSEAGRTGWPPDLELGNGMPTIVRTAETGMTFGKAQLLQWMVSSGPAAISAEAQACEAGSTAAVQKVLVGNLKEKNWMVNISSGKEFSFCKPVWLNDMGHGAWDDEEPGPNEKNLTTSEAGQGEAHKFLGMMVNLFMHRWLPVWELMFIDYTGHARKLALHLIGIMDSPDGMPFPRMDKGFLDLGPDLALNGCELVLLMQEQRDTFGQVLEKLHIGLTSSRGLKAILKTDVEKTCPPQVMHIYSPEAARTGESPNNIAVISWMTNVEWKKEVPEVRAEIMSIQSEQRKLVEAVKAHHYDKISFPPGQKKQ
ncbi:uncharacterized protein EV420DRAFT_1479891 [Desarmillaria tabescens]|uniref:Uncharacterized protein n=1 Tax=Armillaria tabescens TaxID=1929756 RepID=A0AA39KBJ7_ARMTA|nr:uncharacterized protein EV420DRAFT_1479891 [Desarmillaria tabescens]KAK0458137.1 hypothetical protein EV420DRAFT_1479891 [Desarmillaria tabescens]